MTNQQNQPIMDGATEATAAQKREGLEEQIAVDHRGDTAGADADRAVREHQTGLDAAEAVDGDEGEGGDASDAGAGLGGSERHDLEK